VGILLEIVEGQSGSIKRTASSDRLSGLSKKIESRALVVPEAQEQQQAPDNVTPMDDDFKDF